jgi:polar amino acid transport system permease protein
MTWDWSYALSILPQVGHGLWMTVIATILGTVLSMILGLLLALGQRSLYRTIRHPSFWIAEFLRRTPLLVQLYLVFYLLPEFGVLIPPLLAGVIGLGLQTGAYLCEVYRAGIENVPRGQWEAAIALNYSKMTMWTRVILPQAIPPMIPTFGNYVILMFKDSSLLSVISVVELMGIGRDIGNEMYRYLEPVTVIAVIYFVISQIAALGVRNLERRTRWDDPKRKRSSAVVKAPAKMTPPMRGEAR